MSPKKSKAKPGKARATAKKKAAKKVKPKKAQAARKKASLARPKAAKKPAAKRKPAAKKTKKKPAGRAPARAKKATKKITKKPAAKKATSKKAPSKAAAKKKASAGTAAAPIVVKPAPAPAEKAKPKKARRSRRSSRRATIIRRGPDGEILAPGELLLPGGPKGQDEIGYLFRGCMAAEHPVTEEAVTEVLTKRGVPEGPGEREELEQALAQAGDRFGAGVVEPAIPSRTNLKRTFQGVLDRARQRRREIGAFLRGLDMGHTETSHMDAHGEASLQSLMEWAARLENLVENLVEKPGTNQGHYTQFHRVLDQLESTTEALVIDVEQTLRRLRDRLRR
jgi:hypothetical protein